MNDREKVIKVLELCDIGSDKMCYERDCPYYQNGCTERLKEDALELLKEQEDGTMFIYDDYYTPMCQRCGFHPFVGYIPTIEWMKEKGYKVCPHCGRAVNWNG